MLLGLKRAEVYTQHLSAGFLRVLRRLLASADDAADEVRSVSEAKRLMQEQTWKGVGSWAGIVT